MHLSGLSRRTAAITIAGLVLLSVSAFAAVRAARPKLTLSTPTQSRTVKQGQVATYSIKLKRKNVQGPIRIRVRDGLPAGALVTLSRVGDAKPTCTTTAGTRLGQALRRHRACYYSTDSVSPRAVVRIFTTAKTPLGGYRPRIYAVSYGGRAKAIMPLRLTVTASGASTGVTAQGGPSTFALSSPAARQQAAAGSPATFALSLQRNQLTAPISFELISPLPDGVTANFDTSTTSGNGVTLTLTTDGTRTPEGETEVVVRASAAGVVTQTITLTLAIVTPTPAPFPVSGDTAGLRPGLTKALDLAITNSTGDPMSVTALGVGLGAITGPNIDATHPCSPDDFVLVGFSGTLPLRVPPGTHTLSSLGVDAPQLPTITMRDRPVNQDGCKNAAVALTYTGAARRAS